MAGDLSRYTTFPFELPVTVRDLREPVEVEPARSGEGGVDCHLCDRPDSDFLWVDEHWRLSLYSPGPVRGEVILSPRAHVESFARLPPERAAELGGLFGRAQRSIEHLRSFVLTRTHIGSLCGAGTRRPAAALTGNRPAGVSITGTCRTSRRRGSADRR